MTVLSDFIPISILLKLLFGQCFMCTNILQVHFPTSPAAPLLRWLTTQKTDRQYRYYAKNVKRCLSKETICVEHDTLMCLRVSQIVQENHSAHTGKQYRIQTAAKLQNIAIIGCFLLCISTFVQAILVLAKHKHSILLFYFWQFEKCLFALQFID